MTKTIGILGGMGSFATNDFVSKLLELSEPDEFRILVDYAVHIPSRTRAVKHRETSPYEEMAQAMEQLYDWGADIVAVPCNSAHFWYEQMACKTWLNMIEITANAVKDAGYSKPLILGGYVTVEKKLYSEYLPDAVYLTSAKQQVVEKVIQRVKQRNFDCSDKNNIERAVVKREGRFPIRRIPEDSKFDCVIIACTELPLIQVWGYELYEVDLSPYSAIDSSHEYAKAVVEEARK